MGSIGFLDAAPQVATRKLAVWHLPVVLMIHPWHTHTHAQTLSPLITGIGLLLMHHFLSVGRAGKGMGLGGWVRVRGRGEGRGGSMYPSAEHIYDSGSGGRHEKRAGKRERERREQESSNTFSSEILKPLH